MTDTNKALNLYTAASIKCSQSITNTYSTSFSSSIRLLHPDLRGSIFAIYGFVRLADEIVDTFHKYDKTDLLKRFKKDTYEAIDQGISLNPVLNSFQQTVRKYNISGEIIEPFFQSMETDLQKQCYDHEASYNEYIFGSAEVVGLMCLCVFCEGNMEKYHELKSFASSLGAAFQKVNFLRDLKADHEDLQRIYFPNVKFDSFNEAEKKNIEEDIESDFTNAYKGIISLPIKARFGVYVAYRYYYQLFKKIKRLHPEKIKKRRVRIANHNKAALLFSAFLTNQLNMIK